MDNMPDESRFIMGAVGCILIFAIVFFSHDMGHQEQIAKETKKPTIPKYDAKAQIITACEKFSGL